ncbi:MAG: YARHG domain-containing protein [Prevotella sp.]|nr:YARHG domain-containing protein [Prevotella sp.]
MKKLLSVISFCLCALMGVQAQTIQNGSKWWDGSVLYTASVDASGEVTMNGIDAHEGGFRFMLAKTPGKQGRYTLTTDNPDAYMPVRGILGWNVDYIRQDGMYFLAVRKPNNDVVWTLVLTPDNLENCINQERWAEQQPVSDILTTMLLNTTYLARFSKEDLRLMRNEILARHGWKFQSKDLQEHFGKQSWYRPVADNNTIKLNIIEQTNVQLIKSEEAVPDDERGYRDFSSGPEYNSELRALVNGEKGQFPGGLDDDGRGPEEVDDPEVTVFNESQFIGCLRSDRTITVGDNVHLNLSRILENESEFRNRPGRRWCSYDALGLSKEPLIISENISDGQQLTLKNFKNLIIRGGKNSSIEVDPRYAFCIRFVNCEDCTVENLTIGHTEGGFCDGGVIGVKGGRQILVNKCDLYGCGTYGVVLRETTDFSMIKSNIHDCTYGIMELQNSKAVKFTTCDFFNNRQYALIEAWGVDGLVFDDCRFFANWGDAPLFSLDTTFYLMGCQIYHPTEHLGSIDKAEQTGAKTVFNANPLDKNIQSRNLGPQ